MGMDVYGTNGNYFRANIWQWKALLYGMKVTRYCVPDGWYTNDGEGLATQQDCDYLANELQGLVSVYEHMKKSAITYEQNQIRVTQEGILIIVDDTNSTTLKNTTSPYQITLEHMQEFIDFLRDSAGFSIR